MRSGHPWVYDKSVREQNRPGDTGELAVVYDRQDRFLAIGLFDAGSPIRIRILHSGTPQQIDSSWWERQVAAAAARRTGLFDTHTSGYRMINGESDGWPGLVLDRYSGFLVLKLYTAAWLCRLDEIASAIQETLAPECLVLRLSRNIQDTARDSFKLSEGTILRGALHANPVVFLENGLRFEADVLRGQKTGFFLDQRENRKCVGELSAGKRLLNAFSFSGGFSLYAAQAGATDVTDVDISAHALESSKRNHQLNIEKPAVKNCRRHWVQADVFEWLEDSGGEQFDVVVLDPPSLAKREIERAGAIRAYARLARLGAARVRPGGVLACFSCSAHVTAEEFSKACIDGVGSAGGCGRLLETGHAADHPAVFEESKYLKGIYLQKNSRKSMLA